MSDINDIPEIIAFLVSVRNKFNIIKKTPNIDKLYEKNLKDMHSEVIKSIDKMVVYISDSDTDSDVNEFDRDICKMPIYSRPSFTMNEPIIDITDLMCSGYLNSETTFSNRKIANYDNFKYIEFYYQNPQKFYKKNALYKFRKTLKKHTEPFNFIIGKDFYLYILDKDNNLKKAIIDGQYQTWRKSVKNYTEFKEQKNIGF